MNSVPGDQSGCLTFSDFSSVEQVDRTGSTSCAIICGRKQIFSFSSMLFWHWASVGLGFPETTRSNNELQSHSQISPLFTERTLEHGAHRELGNFGQNHTFPLVFSLKIDFVFLLFFLGFFSPCPLLFLRYCTHSFFFKLFFRQAFSVALKLVLELTIVD